MSIDDMNEGDKFLYGGTVFIFEGYDVFLNTYNFRRMNSDEKLSINAETFMWGGFEHLPGA